MVSLPTISFNWDRGRCVGTVTPKGWKQHGQLWAWLWNPKYSHFSYFKHKYAPRKQSSYLVWPAVFKANLLLFSVAWATWSLGQLGVQFARSLKQENTREQYGMLQA